MGSGRYVPSYMQHTTSSRLKGSDKEKFDYYRWKNGEGGNKRMSARHFLFDTQYSQMTPESPRFMKPTSSWEGKVADKGSIAYKPLPRRTARSFLMSNTMSHIPLHDHNGLLDTPRGDRISCHLNPSASSNAASSAPTSPSTCTTNCTSVESRVGHLKCMPVFKSPSLDVPRYMMPTASYNCRLYLD